MAGQWRPIIQTIVTPPAQSSKPTASIGVTFPPKPKARLIDLSQILPSYSLKATLDSKIASPMLEVQHPSGPELQRSSGPELETNPGKEESHKLIANIPETVLAKLRSTCAAKAEVSLLGRIHGKHPGLKALIAWARDTLHPSLSILSLKTNNLFEVTFTHSEGRIHALTQADIICNTAAIFFSSWRPHFDATASQSEESLDHPVWVQIVDLCQVLREENFLRIVGEQIGQVISIDNSEGYRSKLFGPRIRLLVKELNQLPQTVVLPRLDREGTVEYNLEYSGLPHQCGRCRAHDHMVRNCPKKAPPVRKKEVINTKITEQRRGQIKKSEEGILADQGAGKITSTHDNTQHPDTLKKDVNTEWQDKLSAQEEAKWIPVNRSRSGGRHRSVSNPLSYLQEREEFLGKRKKDDTKIAEQRRDQIKKPEEVILVDQGDETITHTFDNDQHPDTLEKVGNMEMQYKSSAQEELKGVPGNRSHTGEGKHRSVASSSSFLRKREEFAAHSQDMKDHLVNLIEGNNNNSSDNSCLQDKVQSKEGSEHVPDNRSCVGDKRSLASVTLVPAEVLGTPTLGAKDCTPVKQSLVVVKTGRPVMGRTNEGKQLPMGSSLSTSLQEENEDLATQTHELAAQVRREAVILPENNINDLSDDKLHDAVKHVPDNRNGEGGKRPITQAAMASSEVLCTPMHRTKVKQVNQVEADCYMLTPDDINFPKLQTPTSGTKKTPVVKQNDAVNKSEEPQFVWKAQQVAKLTPKKHMVESGRRDRFAESTPLTRHWYRSGRMAEDFWTAIGMPNTPTANPKMLRVIPFLTKNCQTDKAAYLVDKKVNPLVQLHMST